MQLAVLIFSFELFTMSSAMVSSSLDGSFPVSNRLANHLGTALPWPAPPFGFGQRPPPSASGLLTTQPTRRGTQSFTTPLRYFRYHARCKLPLPRKRCIKVRWGLNTVKLNVRFMEGRSHSAPERLPKSATTIESESGEIDEEVLASGDSSPSTTTQM